MAIQEGIPLEDFPLWAEQQGLHLVIFREILEILNEHKLGALKKGDIIEFTSAANYSILTQYLIYLHNKKYISYDARIKAYFIRRDGTLLLKKLQIE